MKSFTLTILIFTIMQLFSSCAPFKNKEKSLRTLGDALNSPPFGYTPIDPIPANFDDGDTNPDIDETKITENRIKAINLLNDETMRLAIGTTNASGGITYGKSQIGFKGNKYVVILDYIKSSTIPFPVYVWKDTTRTHFRALTLTNPYDTNNELPADPYTRYVGRSVVPVYVGIGLRITAEVFVLSDTLNLDLFGLGAAASYGRATGSLTVQTLGISGEAITAYLPIPSELNQTTIQNAIVSIGAIKAKIYDDKTKLSPRVVGYYNHIGGMGMEVTAEVISKILDKGISLSKHYYESGGR